MQLEVLFISMDFIHWWGITFHGHDQNYNDETLK